MKNSELLLIEIIQESLNEITRYEKETGTRFNPKKDIEKYVENVDFPNYAFTMTELNKVGVNPGSQYLTPTGVYLYPLDQIHYSQLLHDTLPFMSDAEYVSIVKLNNVGSESWLKFDKHDTDYANFDKLDSLIEYSKMLPDIDDKISRVVKLKISVDKLIFKLSQIIANYRSEKIKIKQHVSNKPKPDEKYKIANIGATEKTKHLRSLGYIGVYDSGTATVHPGEPYQIIALDQRAFKTVATYKTKMLRKSEKGNYNFNKFLISALLKSLDTAVKQMNLFPAYYDNYYDYYMNENHKNTIFVKKMNSSFGSNYNIRNDRNAAMAHLYLAMLGATRFPWKKNGHMLMFGESTEENETIDTLLDLTWEIYQKTILTY